MLKEKLVDSKRQQENDRLMGLAEFFRTSGKVDEAMKYVQQAIDLAAIYQNQEKENSHSSTPAVVNTGGSDDVDSESDETSALAPIHLHPDHLDSDSDSD